MQNNVKVGLHLDSHKRKSDGKSRFSLRVTIGRGKKLFTVFPKKSEQPFMDNRFWVNETCPKTGKELKGKRIKHAKGNSNSRQLERSLLSQLEAMRRLIAKLEAEDRMVTHEVLRMHWQQDHEQDFYEWLSEWLVRYSKHRNIKESSIGLYRKAIAQVVGFEQMGFRTDAGAVSIEWLQRLQDWMLQDVGLATMTVNNYMKLIGTLMRYAKSKGVLARNVYQDFVDQKLLVKADRHRGKFLTEKEVNRLYQAYLNEEILNHPELQTVHGKPIVMAHRLHKRLSIMLFACYSGLRISDLIRVATNHPSLKIEADTFSLKMKKTGKVITIPISDRLRTVANMTGLGPVFEAKTSELTRMNESLQRILQLLKIEKHISFHGLRRSFASYMLNQDVPLKVVSELLGHSNTSVTEQCYAFLNEKRLKEAVSVFDKGRMIAFENPDVREFVEDVYQLLQANPGIRLPKRMQDRIAQLKEQLGLDVLDIVEERKGVFRAV